MLEQPKFARYFKAIIEDRFINANYAPTDPATAEFADVYLAGLGITYFLKISSDAVTDGMQEFNHIVM